MIENAYINICLYVLAIFSVAQSGSSREARQRAFSVAVVGTIVSAICLLLHQADDWWAPFPLMVSVICLVATGLSSLANTTRRSYAAMLLLSAISTSYLLLPTGWLLGVPWCTAMILVWFEVRQRSLKTARVFAFYMGASTLLAFLGLAFSSRPEGLLCLALALCIKEACFPFHSWFPSFVESTPMGVVVTFVTPQVGVFLHLKFLAQQLPHSMHIEVATIGILTALFGAALATVQSSLKRTLAYLFVSQSGLVAFGLESSSKVGQAGALAAWFVVGLGMAGFAMSIEALVARRGSDPDLRQPGRDFESTPALATSFMLSGLALVGLPGTLGFVSEDLLVQGSVHEFPALGFFLIVVTALNAMTIMRSLFSVFAGPRCEVSEDLNGRERSAITVVLGLLFLLGMMPELLLHWFG
ncbi:MAG: hypothetical protein KC800_34000 [Candidatus Eremiobacteraeota bacterium]|nr:hypothetical protein [Candidatus Eremiobacteraeota bacterium]